MDNILLRILLDSYERRQKAEPGTGKNDTIPKSV